MWQVESLYEPDGMCPYTLPVLQMELLHSRHKPPKPTAQPHIAHSRELYKAFANQWQDTTTLPLVKPLLHAEQPAKQNGCIRILLLQQGQ